MKKLSAAELKKAILAVEAERSKYPAEFRPDRAQRASLRKSRQASEKMVSGFLKQAGLDLGKLRTLREQRSAELERMVAQHKKQALRLASQRKDTLYSSVAARSKALRDLAAREDFFPHPTFTLDTPFLIWSIPLLEISDSAAVPFGSWAKFKLSTSQSGTQKVGFYFYWVNPFAEDAVINVATFLSATGHLKAHAPWTFWANSSRVWATALLNLWFGWPSGVTSSSGASAFLGGTGALGALVLGGDTGATSISQGVSLDATMFTVPPGNVAVFEVAVALDYRVDDGNIEADFQSGDFRIACPVVVFSLLNSPAGAMA